MSDETTAPPVVAVVVTCNPGSWFEESMQALAAQDYPNLAVLVIDAASSDDPLPRVAAELPTAYVRRLSRNPGYAAAANRALRIVQGATHLVMCHDDVALAPDAVTRMVEEAFRYNAGIVAPKQVAWSDPDELVAMGATVDRTGALLPTVEAGDYDQGQHDNSGETFIATGGCVLVRADLFESLGGFDGSMTLYGEDVDLSWRAALVGARVVTAPSARVRHLQAASKGMRLMAPPSGDDADSSDPVDEMVLKRRHRLRTVLKTRSRRQLPTAIIQLAAISVLEVIYSLLVGRHSQASAVGAAWSWNLSHLRGLWKARRQLRRARVASNAQIAARMGSWRDRMEGVLRREWEIRREKLQGEGWKGRDVVARVRNLTFAVWALVIGIWYVGSREILDALPVVGQFTPFAASPMEAFGTYFGTLAEESFGSPVPTSAANLIVGLLGTLMFGSMELARLVLVLAMLPLGIWGVVRLSRPLSSTRSRLAAVVAYAAVPVPYEALSSGHLHVLVAYAACPWILHRILRAHGSSPYFSRRSSDSLVLNFRRQRPGDEDDLARLVFSDAGPMASGLQSASQLSEKETESKSRANRIRNRDRVLALVLRRIVPMALLLASAAVLSPQLLLVTVVVAGAVALGSIVAGSSGGESPAPLQTVVVAAAGAALALVLLIPGLNASAAGIASVWNSPLVASDQYDFVDFLNLGSLFSVGLLVAGMPGLLMGKQWRFRLSAKLWFATFGVALFGWIANHGWISGFNPEPGIVMAMVGAITALNAAVGIHTLGADLPAYRIGWRKVMPVIAVGGLVVALLPVGQAAVNGSWRLPSLTTTQLLSWMNPSEGSFRVLWLGDADALVGDARIFDEDLSAAVAVDQPTPTGPSAPVSGGDVEAGLAQAVLDARQRNTVSLGAMMAPYGVRYIVVPNANGASGAEHESFPPPSDVVPSLNSQLDLVTVETDRALAVYENTAWLPLRASLTAEGTLAARDDATKAPVSFDGSESKPVLGGGDPSTRTGTVESGEVFVGERGGRQWSLTVDGSSVSQQDAFGWATSFDVPRDGDAVLKYSPPLYVPVVQTLVVIGWLSLALLSFRFRPRRGRYT